MAVEAERVSSSSGGGDLLRDMRDSFAKGDWYSTLAIYERLRTELDGQRSRKVEAACLAARAHVASKNRSAARKLLKSVARREYSKATYYHFLAYAFLDLKNYAEAGMACERAQALTEAKRSKESEGV